jgi:hypothetical protein
MGRLVWPVPTREDALTSCGRISEILVAALLYGSVLTGGVMLPGRSFAQSGNAVVSVEVQPKDRQRAGGCDVVVRVLQGEAEWTFPNGERRRLRQGETACVQGNAITVVASNSINISNPPTGGGGTGCVSQITPTRIDCP